MCCSTFNDTLSRKVYTKVMNFLFLSLKRLPWSALLIAMTLLSTTGCTLASLGGRFADWYAMRRIDEQVDLSKEQRSYLEPRLKEHMQWLKKEFLPIAATSINDLINRVEKGVSADDITWLEQLLDDYKLRIYQRIKEDAIWLLSNLSSDQLQYMNEQRLDRKKTADKRLDVKEEAYRKRRFEHYEDLCEHWLGSVSDDQRQLIQKTLAPLATLEHARIYEDGRSIVSELLIEVSTPPVNREKLEAFVSEWVRDPASLRPDPPEKQYRERMTLIRDLILGLSETMTPVQKKHLVSELHKLQKRIRDFAST